MENPIKMDDLGVPLFLETPSVVPLGTTANFFCRVTERNLPETWHLLGGFFFLWSIDFIMAGQPPQK